MYNKMIDGLWCECGGKYLHVHQEQDDDGVLDSYQCERCKTWCLITWNPETEEELKRVYSQEEELYTLSEIDRAMCAVDDKTDLMEDPISAAKWRAMVLEELQNLGASQANQQTNEVR